MSAAASPASTRDSVRMLLANGADVQARDDEGNATLDWALLRGESPVTSSLRAAGATPTPKPPAPVLIASPWTPRRGVETALARCNRPARRSTSAASASRGTIKVFLLSLLRWPASVVLPSIASSRAIPEDAASHRSRMACLSRAPGTLPPPRPPPTRRKIGWS